MDGYALQLSEQELARYRGMAERARVSEADLWASAGIAPGARIADVGCGPGATLAVMAQMVGPSGWVTGVDGDENAVHAAEQLLAAAGVVNADLRVGRADETGLEPGTFDVAVLRHVLAHNGGIEQRIVNHLATLVRPGGAVYLVDVDLSSMRIMPSAPELADIMDKYVDFHRSRGNDPLVGLSLNRLARTAGLTVSDFRGRYDIMEMPAGMRPPPWAAREAMVASGVATEDDVRRWGAALDQMDTIEPRPMVFPSVFVAIGRRPGI
jgi:SAM-dependent methyltransferase